MKNEKNGSKVRTRRWDPARYLKTEQDIVTYLEAALEDGEPSLIAAALGDVARARGMTQLARKTGLGRESLYKALSPEGNTSRNRPFVRPRVAALQTARMARSRRLASRGDGRSMRRPTASFSDIRYLHGQPQRLTFDDDAAVDTE